jgi:elongation factor G-like protein
VTVTIARRSGLITGTSPAAGALSLTGTLPTRSVQPLLAQLPGQTGGEAVFTSEVTHYTPVAGPAPARTRTGPDPLDRQEWFRAHPRLPPVASPALAGSRACQKAPGQKQAAALAPTRGMPAGARAAAREVRNHPYARGHGEFRLTGDGAVHGYPCRYMFSW